MLKGTSCRLHWDQPQGHRESKELLTRCALHQREPPRGKEPGPRLKFHQKVGAWSGVPCTSNPCLNSAAALALSSGPAAPRPEGALAFPANVRPTAGATLLFGLRGGGQPELGVLFTKTRSSASSTARGCTTLPRSSAATASRASYKHSLPNSSFSHHLCPSFSKMAAKALPACVLTGASGWQLEVPRSGFHPLSAA